MRVHALIVDASPEERERLRAALGGTDLQIEDLQRLEWLQPERILFLDSMPQGPGRFFVRREGKLLPIRAEEITRVEACGDYVQLHADGHAYLVHMNLKQMRNKLEPTRFLQIHRSHVVNLDHVTHLRPHDDRRFRVSLRDGSEIVASRAGSQQLKSMLA